MRKSTHKSCDVSSKEFTAVVEGDVEVEPGPVEEGAEAEAVLGVVFGGAYGLEGVALEGMAVVPNG